MQEEQSKESHDFLLWDAVPKLLHTRSLQTRCRPNYKCQGLRMECT